uniref:FBA_2 domain-containing protein n=2 Tax=Caenorhabditis tropicalis TaxID=1561998 RepID=A0A1I7T3N3_9PELO
MDATEQVKLALSSKKIKDYIRFANVRYFDYCQITIEGEHFSISLSYGCEWCKQTFREYQEPVELIGKEMEPWSNEKLSVIENAITVLKQLQTTFPCKETGVIIIEKEPAEVKKILGALDNFIYVSLSRERIEAVDVDVVMEFYKKGREIAINGSEMPLDYYHRNAFKFHIIYYEDARWVKLGHLFSMKGAWSVELGKNNFNCEDMNALLKHWMTCEGRREEDLFEGLISLKVNTSGYPFRLLANHQNHLLLYVSLETDQLTIGVYYSDEPVMLAKGTRMTREYRILEILQRKKVLEDESEIGENWNKIEIRQLEEELARNGVYYVDGTPYVDDL